MTDTTSFNDLPVDPAGVGHNIALSVQEPSNPISNINNNSNSSITLDQTTISQLINGLAQASTTGVTQLPSREISQQTATHIQDPFIQPNYVPQPMQKSNYINNYETNEDIINNYKKINQSHNRLDDIYNDIQIPILLAVIYFLFQLPIFRKTLFHYLPLLFSSDGNYNLKGFLFTSSLFGILYYILNKLIFQ